MNINAETLFKKGVESFRAKNFVEAETIFLELKSFYPTNKDILKNLSICFFQNKKFEKCENTIKNMLDLGFKERKLIEYLLLVLKKQDNVKEILNLIHSEKENINPKYRLLEKFERPAISMDVNEIEDYRKKSLEKIDNELSEKSLNLDVDQQFLDPPLFYYSYDDKNNLELSKKLNLLFRNSYPDLNQKFSTSYKDNEKIKIGFVSEYFKNHTISKLFKGLILNLDNSIFDINIFYLDNGKEIDEEYLKHEKDGKLKKFKLPKLFKEKINFISGQNLDLVFYPDIGMSTQLFYLTFLRLAKYQITSWGHPETTGNPNIDYFLSSKLLEIDFENAKDHYTEQLILMDHLPMYYFKPKIKKINDEELVSKNIYSCPQTLFKFHPDFDEAIYKILKNDKNAKIFLIKGKEISFTKKTFERLKKKVGIDMDKITFLDPMTNEEYINHCGRASVLLDPFYFGAGNSFHESMFYGTPTISKPNQFMRSKIVEGAYKQMKIEEPPIFKSLDEYVHKAIEFANFSPKKILETKKYFSKCANENLFENKEVIKDFHNTLLNIIKK